MSRRVDRLNEQLKREIAHIVHLEVKDPRVGATVVTAVETAPDLTFARVFVSMPADQAAETLEGLGAAAPFIRSALAQRLELRRVPELRFQRDRTMERAQRIEELLAEVMPDQDRAAEDEGDEAEGAEGAEGAAGAGGGEGDEGWEGQEPGRE